MSMASLFKEYAKTLLDIVAPASCHLCSGTLRGAAPYDAAVCRNCVSSMRRTPLAICELCGDSLKSQPELTTRRCGTCRKGIPPYNRLKTCYLYEGKTRELTHIFKYGNRPYLAKTVASLMKDALAQDGDRHFETADLLVPVPLHPSREREREFNQSHVLAQALSAFLAAPVVPILKRIRNTRPQVELGPQERKLNLLGAFALTANLPDLRDKKIILIDDIVTTASTVRAAARPLAGACTADISVLAFAKG